MKQTRAEPLLRDAPALLRVTLTTTGRRTGERREAALYAFQDGERLVIVGSSAGRARDPAWALNLRANPRAEVRRGPQTRAVVAREVDGEERDRLWALVCAAFPLYATYQRRTSRRIPLFVLTNVAR
jgi:deazaflavin-dependent oxidoreductase (nitroreductase family)